MSKTQLKKQRQMQEAAQRQMQAQGMGGGLGSLMGGLGGDDAPPMPVMPDKKAIYFWKPKGDNTPKEAFDVSKFQQIWPIYINSNLTKQQGRRMPKESCCPDPLVAEMSEICQSYNLRHALEPYRQYPRTHLKTGRIRVEIVKGDGTFCHEEIRSKKDLMRCMGEKIPSLNSRIKRLEEQEEKKKAEAQEAAKTPSSSSSGTSSKKKKKGKK